MQVNNSEFFTAGGGSAATTAERPGDGLFDALLREEEARYEEAPPRDPGRHDAHRRDDDRPDDYRLDDRQSDAYRDDDYRDSHGEQHDRVEDAGNDGYDDVDRPGDAEEHAHAQDPVSKDRDPAEGDRHGEGPETVIAGDDTAPTVRQAADKSETQAANAKDQTKGQPVSPATDQAAKTAAGTAGQAAAIIGAAQAGSGETASAGTASDGGAASANTVAGTVAGQAAARTATQGTADTVPSAKPAATGKAAGKAGETVAEAQNAKGQAASPTANKATQPAAGANGKPTIDDLLVTTSQAGLTSRPTAALGGAAATAAMVGEAKPAATNANSGKQTKAKTGEGLLSAVNGPQKPGAAKAGPVTDPSAAAGKGDKPSIAAGAAGTLPPDSLNIAGSGGQSQPITATAAGSGFGSGSVQNASFTEALNTARGGASAPAEQIAVQVHKAQLAGKDQLNIKLHPAELGRIEVKLENRDDGVLRVVISAERSETLDLLQRDSRGLERALQDAGVKTDSGSLSFNLKGQQQPGQENAGGQGANPNPPAEAEIDDPTASPPPPALAHHDGALDIRV